MLESLIELCGFLSIQLSEFWNMTPSQFYYFVKGAEKRYNSELRESWEQTRLLGLWLYNKPVYGYNIKTLSNPKSLLKFDWEKIKAKDNMINTNDFINLCKKLKLNPPQNIIQRN